MSNQITPVAGTLAAMVAIVALALPASANAAGQQGTVVVRDPQTGRLRAPTADEMKTLREQGAALQPAAPQSAPGVVTTREDGTVQRHLGDSGMVYSVMTRDADGKLVMQCIQGKEAAEAAATRPAPAPTPTQEHSHESR